METDFGQEIDLHHFHPADTETVVSEFLRQSKAAGFRSVRIVHGKGRSAKKLQVRKMLENDPDIEAFGDDGPNWGATVALIRVGSAAD